MTIKMQKLQAIINRLDCFLAFFIKNYPFFTRVFVILCMGRLITLEKNQLAQVIEALGLVIYIINEFTKSDAKDAEIDTE